MAYPLYQPDFLNAQEAQSLWAFLTSAAVSWQREWFQLFGRRIAVPRRLVWYGDEGVNYRYTGADHVACGWPIPLQPVHERVCDYAQRRFNYLLVNRYADGTEHMGWHRDDEKYSEPLIASLNLGATRRFRIRPDGATASQSYDLAAGSLLLMNGHHRHMLAKTARPVGERINLTFRCIRAD